MNSMRQVVQRAVAAAGVEDVDAGLLDGEHETLAGRHVERAGPFNGQFRHELHTLDVCSVMVY